MLALLKIPAWAAAPAAGLATAAAVAGIVVWRASNLDIRAAATSPAASAGHATVPVETLPAKPLPAITLPDAPLHEAPKAAAPAEVAAEKAATPAFDIVRVEPGGDTLVAGRGAAGASIALVDTGGQVLAQGKIDKGGQFVLLPGTLPQGDHLLSLRMAATDQKPVTSQQDVAVSVADASHGGVLVALAEPGKPTVILSDKASPPVAAVVAAPLPADVAAPASQAADTAALQPSPAQPVVEPPLPKPAAAVVAPVPEPPAADVETAPLIPPRVPAAVAVLPAVPTIAIRTVEVEAGSGFFATGQAAPGADVRLYLNGSFVAALKADSSGHWSLKISRGMKAGHYFVRADQLAAADGSVLARAEVPFDYPANATGFLAKKLFASKVAAPPASPAIAGDQAENQVSARVQDSRNLDLAKPDLAKPDLAKPDLAKPDLPNLRAVADQPPAVAASGPQAKNSADIVVRELQTATVLRGDSLWRISRKSLGKGIRYTQIYEANTRQIRNPRLIYIGQVLVMPVSPMP